MDMMSFMKPDVGLVLQMPYCCTRKGFAAVYEKVGLKKKKKIHLIPIYRFDTHLQANKFTDVRKINQGSGSNGIASFFSFFYMYFLLGDLVFNPLNTNNLSLTEHLQCLVSNRLENPFLLPEGQMKGIE